MDIKKYVEEYEKSYSNISFAIQEMAEKVKTIAEKAKYDPHVEHPPSGQTLKKFEINNEGVMTSWRVYYPYDDFEEKTYWYIPFDWFGMDDTQLEEVVLKVAKEKGERKAYKEIARLQNLAEHYGYTLLKRA